MLELELELELCPPPAKAGAGVKSWPFGPFSWGTGAGIAERQGSPPPHDWYLGECEKGCWRAGLYP